MDWDIFTYTVLMIGVGFAFGHAVGKQNARPATEQKDN